MSFHWELVSVVRRWAGNCWDDPRPARLGVTFLGTLLVGVPVLFGARVLPTALGAALSVAWLSVSMAIASAALFAVLAAPKPRTTRLVFMSGLLATASVTASGFVSAGHLNGLLVAVGVVAGSVLISALAAASLGGVLRVGLWLVDQWRSHRDQEPLVAAVEQWLTALPKPTRALVVIGLSGLMWRCISWLFFVSPAEEGPMAVVGSGIRAFVPWLDSLADNMIGGGLIALFVQCLVSESEPDNGEGNRPGIVEVPSSQKVP